MSGNLLSIDDLSRGEVLDIFAQADQYRTAEHLGQAINTELMGSLLFFEASTRTRLGFEAAAWKLGIKTLLLSETKTTENMSVGESVADTVRTLEPFSDFFCLRHPDEQVLQEVVSTTRKLVINCGNGHDEHPTQALIDGYSIWHRFGQIDGLSVSLLGQLKYSRAAHSLLRLLAKFNEVSVRQFAPAELMTDDYTEGLMDNGNSFNSDESPSLGDEDVLYVTGFPPRNPSGEFTQEIRDKYKVTANNAANLKSSAIILNPLPRIDEIDPEVDASPHAYYWKQNELGLFVRMAIIQTFALG